MLQTGFLGVLACLFSIRQDTAKRANRSTNSNSSQAKSPFIEEITFRSSLRLISGISPRLIHLRATFTMQDRTFLRLLLLSSSDLA
ncbi:hypothetical protein BP00DRAFT_174326 [Aspergillus indologenus CBS 114.80]|uniref:Uncharacterized protein n=1 Tax=Aspergillus indologenus CBS 114.80 TaxID=1450541 RepID=A0A2V5I442_9EURO|nr:hypothetical protein BP00DRAFT_174326 [Aspergillus indologenus CBS 114.80]